MEPIIKMQYQKNTRNSLLPVEYFADPLFYCSNVEPEEFWASYKKINQKAFGTSEYIDFLGLTTGYCLDFIRAIGFAYTRGDTLESIDATYIQPGIERFIKTCEEIEKQERKGIKYYYSPFRGCIPSYSILSIYTLMAWFICFGVEESKLRKIAPFIVPENTDPLIDTVFARYQPERKIATEAIECKTSTFTFLLKAIDADETKRISLINAYLDNWGEIVANIKSGPSLGTVRSKRVSNKNLYKEIEGKDDWERLYYMGHWAWEVALVVKLFDIDDSSFRDNPLYPVEMVDYKK